MTATYIRPTIRGFNTKGHLYRFNPPVPTGFDADEYAEYLVIETKKPWFGELRSETWVVNEAGQAYSRSELHGAYWRNLNHADVVRKLGYKIVPSLVADAA